MKYSFVWTRIIFDGSGPRRDRGKECGEAEKHLRNTTVDVLFTDIEMPGSNLNGLELAALVGKEWPSIPVLVTSGKVIPSNDERSFGFLPKPYLARDVIAGLRKQWNSLS